MDKKAEFRVGTLCTQDTLLHVLSISTKVAGFWQFGNTGMCRTYPVGYITISALCVNNDDDDILLNDIKDIS